MVSKMGRKDFFHMNDLNLSRRLVASKNWIWKKRMRTNAGIIVDMISQSDIMLFDEKTSSVSFKNPNSDGVLPDLGDKQTLQIILEALRDRLGKPNWEPQQIYHDPTPDWIIDPPSADRQVLYGSYISALVEAFCR